jgi:dTDP-glucose 4,6-dehydratase
MSLNNYQFHNVLITGGAGFIGANFIRYLLGHFPNVHIYNLDLLTYAGSKNNLLQLPDPTRHCFIQGDICDAALVGDILQRYDIDTIVHFAAESHVDRSIAGPAPFIHTNLVGTFTLLEGARKYWSVEKKWDSTRCRFHHISTDEVFGTLKAEDEPFTEQTSYAPNSPYSASKAGSDHLVRAYWHTYHLPMTISHCSNNYGPYQHPEKWIPTIIRSCLEWQPITIYGDGSHIRDWLYVDDHCKAILAILQHGRLGETYNIGGSNELSNVTVAKNICHLMDLLYPQEKSYQSLIQFVTDRLGHDWRYAINYTKLSNELGWHPQETMKTGIHKTIYHYTRSASRFRCCNVQCREI